MSPTAADPTTFYTDLYQRGLMMGKIVHEIHSEADKKMQETMECIRNLRVEDSINETRLYSRACSICVSDSPCQRSVFTGCGHVSCRACAEQMELESSEEHLPFCPMCREQSVTRILVETKEECINSIPSSLNYIQSDEDTQDDAEPSLQSDEWENLLPSQSTRREQLIRKFMSGEIDEDTYTTFYDLSLATEASRRVIDGGRLDDVYDEEYDRIIASLPAVARDFPNLAMAAVEVTRRKEKYRVIDELRARDNEGGLYSRACGNCHSSSPLHRCAFTVCGHIICRPCTEEMKMKTSRSQIVCPFCQKESETVALFEDLIEA